jgi:SET domain
MLELQESNTKVLTQKIPDERDMVMLAREFALSKSVEEVESTMLGMPQAEAQVIHRFGPGIYIREVIIPAGILAVGHRQRFEHMNVMLKGRVTVFNDNGTTTELVAPMVFVGKPGRKIGYVHEEMVWQNIYATTETDIEKLEATYLEKSDTWRQDQVERAAALALRYEADRQDYLALLAEVGIPHEIARAQSENTDDQIPMPLGSYSMMVADSPIEGKGVFATANISEGAVIAPARIDGKRTPAGRYTNHSVAPNAIMVKRPNGDIDLVATRQIAGCTGGQPGEEITIDYRQALRLSGIGSLE